MRSTPGTTHLSISRSSPFVGRAQVIKTCCSCLKAHSFKLAEPPVTESIGLIELRSPIKPSPGRPGNHDRNAAMTDKKSLTGIEQDVQIEERTRHAMENYFNWLHSAILASPWSNNLNKKLLSYATENVTCCRGTCTET